MKKRLLFKKLLLLCMLIASGATTRADYYKKVTSSSDLVDGGTYILAGMENGGYSYVATGFNNNLLNTTYTGFTVDGDRITQTTATFLEFTFEGNSGNFTLKDNNTSNYLAYCIKNNSAGTDLYEQNNNSQIQNSNLKTYPKWLLTASNAIQSSYSSSSHYLALSKKNNNTTDRNIKAYQAINDNYAGVYLYRKILPATVTPADYATFVPPHNVEFASGDAYVITAANDVVTMQGVTQVPAGTPVLLKGEGTKEATVLDSEVAAPAQNLLQVSDGSINADSHVYVLSKKNGKMGFYLWTGESLNAGKVYLTIPGSAREFIGFDDTTTTEIFQIEDTRGKKEDTVYDLQGRKTTNGQLQRGLYIVNGKKVLIK